MPEGPETWRDARRIVEAVGGHRTTEVWFAFERLAPYADLLSGDRVVDVRARGKAILIGFEVGLVVVTHSHLWGRWRFAAGGTRPRTSRSLRLSVEAAHRAALLYSASDVRVLPADGLDGHPYLAKLGPDALDPEVDEAAVRERLDDRRFRGRGLGHLLLDPTFVAGIGNYLRCEILFEAGLSAEVRPESLRPSPRRRLARAILEVPRRALATGGRTVPEGLTVPADPPRPGRVRPRRPRHMVYGRAGRPCLRCGAVVVRGRSAGRPYDACPRCQ